MDTWSGSLFYSAISIPYLSVDGGYTSGSKNHLNRTANFLRSGSSDASSYYFIFVSINYRLGAFGWLSGPSFESENGTMNVGLLDQHMAIQWVQNHIHLFSGDRDRIYVTEESASALSQYPSSITRVSQHTNNKRQAIPPRELHDRAFKDFLRLANVSTLSEARTLPSERLIAVNAAIVGGIPPYAPSPFGAAIYDSDDEQQPDMHR